MGDAWLSEKAFCKIILHTMKYPHCTVNGVLLAEKCKIRDSRALSLVDCIPLFHLGLGLAPMLEIALAQIDIYCKEKGLLLAGYYQANANYRDCNPDFFAHKIGEKLHENCNDAVILMVDNQKLSMDCTSVPLHLYHVGDGKLKPKDSSSIHLENEKKTLATLRSLLENKRHQTLVDFDNHLDNVALSWENELLNEEISHCL